VAPGHQQGGAAAGEALASGPALGVGRVVCQHLTVARVAEGLAVSWNTANDAVLAEGKRVLIENPGRFEAVTVIGVDEHVVRHEALLFRMEVEDLHGLVVVAAR